VAYTRLKELEACVNATSVDLSLAKLIFGLYHTVKIGDEFYALHEDGVLVDGTVTCCHWCAHGVKAKRAKMESLAEKSDRALFFKYDPTLDIKEVKQDGNVVRLPPIKETWIEWDYGKLLQHYVKDDGAFAKFDIGIDDLSSAEIQSVSPLVVASKIVKLKSRVDKHLDGGKNAKQVTHKITAHIITMPTSSNREIYKTMCTNLPRLDVPKFCRTLYFGTERTYAAHVAFQMNQGRNALRQEVIEPILKGMRQANNFFAEFTRFRKTTSKQWDDQKNALQTQGIMYETSKTAKDVEEIIRSDVTKGWRTDHRTSQSDKRGDAECTNVMVTSTLPLDPDHQFLNSMLNLYREMKEKDNVDEAMNINILNKPINEYDNNPELIHLAFPTLFPLGVTARQIRTRGTLKQSTIRRLLCSADGRFARNKTFQFLLNDQKMRSQNNMSVSLRIDATTEMSKKFVDFVNSEECDKLCDAALANPKGRAARILLSKIRPLIQICGTRTKWCPFERMACKGKLFSMAQIFNPFSLFMTVSPKALDCLLVIKNAAIQRGFTDKDIEAVKGPTGLNARVRLVSENPVAQARAFQHLVDGFLTIIVGYDEKKPNNKGIFGTPLSYFGPVEAQHRGGLHLHLEAQMKELRPELMQRFAKDSCVRKAFVNYINSIVTGSTRGFEHIEIAARQERERKSHCGSAPVLWKPAIDFAEHGSVYILGLVRISSNSINACETFFDSYINGSNLDSIN
jgi:hypothetical protein